MFPRSSSVHVEDTKLRVGCKHVFDIIQFVTEHQRSVLPDDMKWKCHVNLSQNLTGPFSFSYLSFITW